LNQTLPPILIIASMLALVACAEPVERAMDGATIEPSPNCTLTCLVTWTTTEEAFGAVEFGEGELQFRVEGATKGTDHEVLVVGMHTGATYTLQAISTFDDGEEMRSRDLEFVPGELPEPLLTPSLDVYDEARVHDGWTLTNVATGLVRAVMPLILDMNGEVVWYHRHNDDEVGFPDQVAQLLDDYHVLVGPGVPAGEPVVEIDLQGEVYWEGPQQPDDILGDGRMHHVLEKLDNGHYMVIYFRPSGPDIADEVAEIDEDGQTVWSWHTLDHLDPHPHLVHANALHVDLEQDVLYLNSYEEHVTWKIDRSDGAVLWTLGEGGDFAGDQDNTHPWFSQAHGAKVLPDNHFLYYDNGTTDRGFSRVIELAVDESTMEAEIVWEYPGELAEDLWYSFSWGDADRLDNGNTLINTGSGPGSPADQPSRTFEVTPEGEVVWQITWSLDPEKLGAFEAERIPPYCTPLD